MKMIISTFICLMICAVIMTVAGVLIAVLISWIFRNNLKFEDLEDWEEDHERS